MTMTAERYAAYIDAFNRGDSDGYSQYYADDVVLVLAGDRTLHGKKEIVDFYRDVRAGTSRTIRVLQCIAEGDHFAAELESEFLALQDLPDFTAGALRTGDRIYLNSFILCELRNDRFVRIRSAVFRKIERLAP